MVFFRGKKHGEGRYLLNLHALRLHDTDHLSEKCNTDDIAAKFRSDSETEIVAIYPNLMRCKWCMESRP